MSRGITMVPELPTVRGMWEMNLLASRPTHKFFAFSSLRKDAFGVSCACIYMQGGSPFLWRFSLSLENFHGGEVTTEVCACIQKEEEACMLQPWKKTNRVFTQIALQEEIALEEEFSWHD